MLPSNALFVVLHKQPRLALRLSLVICFEMPTFMFWNIAKNDVSEAIAAACIENEIDLLIMAECNIPEVKLLTKLNSGSSRQTYTEIHKGVSQLRMFTRLPESGVTAVYDDGRVAIRRIAPPVGREVLLVAAHLPSKLHTDKETQYLRVRGVRSEIDRAEKKAGHKNTIIIGDLNMNPFEEAIVAADGFHAVMDKSVAMKRARMVQGLEYDFFYNPMWSRLGDNSQGPSGTYYYNAAGALINYFWNTFDQVLIRPELIEFFDHSSLKVLTEIDGQSLIKKQSIDSDFSDHLPLIVTIDVEKQP